MAKTANKGSSDHHQIKKAGDLIKETVHLNSQIDASHWLSAMAAIIAQQFFESGYSFEEYENVMKSATNFYKFIWEEEKG